MSRFYGAFIIFLLPLFLFGQSSPAFYAISSHKSIPAGEVFRLEYTLENAKGSSFNAPSFKELKLISGPSISSQYINNNGQVSEFTSYKYQLMAMEEGEISIAPATIMADGNRLTSNTVNITVTKQRERTKMEDGLPSEEDVFVRLECKDTIAHVGQQILLQLIIYSRISISSYKLLYEPGFDAFYSLGGRNPRSPAETVEIDGKMYEKRALKNYPLFPQQTGDYVIDPMHLSLTLPGERRRNSFFFNSGKQLPATTNALTIKVRDLPENPPSSFSGAIGKYELNAGIDKKELTTDDAITLQIVISGDGDPKLITAPKIKFDDRFEVYDPTLSYEDEKERVGLQYHNKVFEYLLVPLEAGKYEILPEFTYYDIDSVQYVTLTDGPFEINVTKGRLNRNLSTIRKKLSDEELAPVVELVVLSKRNFKLLEQNWFYGLFGIPLIGFIIAFRLKQKQEALNAQGPLERKRAEAKKVALAHLASANRHMIEKNEKAFYKALSSALLGYVSDKLGMEQADISKNNVQQKLKSLLVNENEIQRFISLLQNAEMALYAGSSPGDMQHRYDEASELLIAIEAAI